MGPLDRLGGYPGKLRLAVHVAMTRDGDRGGIFDCKVCTLHYCDEDGARTWIGPDGKTQRSRGPAPEPMWRFERGWGLGDHTTCPKPKMPDNWGLLISLHAAWKSGTLYGPGGMAQQPAPYVDAMTLIESERAKIEKHQLEQDIAQHAQRAQRV